MKIFEFEYPNYPPPEIKVDMKTETLQEFMKVHRGEYLGSWLGYEDQRPKYAPSHIFIIGGKLIQIEEVRPLGETTNETM